MSEAPTTSTARTEELGFIGLTSGETRRLARRSAPTSSAPAADAGAGSGGTIYTEHDMPTLERLLADYQVAVAILERSDPPVFGDVFAADVSHTSAYEEERSSVVQGAPEFRVTTSPTLLAAAGAIAGGTTAVGVTLVVAALLPNGLDPNPYIALSALLAGVTYIVSLLVAFRREM